MIRAELEVPRSSNPPLVEKTCFTEPHVSVVPTSHYEIEKIVFGLTKTCEIDPLLGKQIQQCLSSLVPVITAITNKSLDEGTMPSALKVTCVHPLLKKPSLDRDMLCNYRPVSTLSLIYPRLFKRSWLCDCLIILIHKTRTNHSRQHITDNIQQKPHC